MLMLQLQLLQHH